MKKILASVLCLCLLPLCGCKGGCYESSGEGLDIVTTVFPAFDFAREIAGDKARVCLLVPPGSESHSFEPTAQDILRIQNCDLLICNGGESEVWMEEILEGMEAEVPRLVMLDCVQALEEEVKAGMQIARHDHGEDEHEGHNHEEAEYDEHVWTSPKNAALISRAIGDALCGIDPANSAYYAGRTESYCEKLFALDAGFRALAESSGHPAMIFADRFPARYFVEEYGLDYYAAFPGCAEEAEPSARTVAFLIDKVRQEQVPAVFYIEFSNQKMADVICEDTGCQKRLFHCCHNVTRQQLDEGISYLGLMEQNLNTLREALG
ncbi:MAG: metal ABC transporter substrate-binding protein [Candidatus Limivicinus sp.]